MIGNELLLESDDLVDTSICLEHRFDVFENSDRAVGSSTTVKSTSSTHRPRFKLRDLPKDTLSLQSRRDGDGVVEGQSDDLMRFENN